MNQKNLTTYVSREIKKILQNYFFVKIYMDDIIVFINTLNKYLKHFNQIFELFRK